MLTSPEFICVQLTMGRQKVSSDLWQLVHFFFQGFFSQEIIYFIFCWCLMCSFIQVDILFVDSMHNIFVVSITLFVCRSLTTRRRTRTPPCARAPNPSWRPGPLLLRWSLPLRRLVVKNCILLSLKYFYYFFRYYFNSILLLKYNCLVSG